MLHMQRSGVRVISASCLVRPIDSLAGWAHTRHMTSHTFPIPSVTVPGFTFTGELTTSGESLYGQYVSDAGEYAEFWPLLGRRSHDSHATGCYAVATFVCLDDGEYVGQSTGTIWSNGALTWVVTDSVHTTVTVYK